MAPLIAGVVVVVVVQVLAWGSRRAWWPSPVPLPLALSARPRTMVTSARVIPGEILSEAEPVRRAGSLDR